MEDWKFFGRLRLLLVTKQVILSLAGKSVARFIGMLFDVYGRLKSFMPFGLREVHVNSF